MRYLEVRRHAMRTKPGQHLSQSGVTLARHVGATLGPFDRVITSQIPRAYETAIAMGFAVDWQAEEIGLMSEDVTAQVAWDAGFAAFALAATAPDSPVARYALAQAVFWRSVIADLPDGGRVLMVTHGGIVEAGAVGCLPTADHQGWGRAVDYCEGVRLAFDGERFVECLVRRVLDR
jgi:broad specificity phosphatase PhoE